MHNPPPPATLLQEERRRLRCPRCDSGNTKFCYFNNYNLSQPRHYCRDCRRYWTHGGALRNVPVGGGGGTRKSSKRAASSSSSSVSPSKRPDTTPSGAAHAAASSSPTETSPAIPLNGGEAVEPTPTLSPRAPAQEDAAGLPADANCSNGAGSLPDLSIYTPPNSGESSETSSESRSKTVARSLASGSPVREGSGSSLADVRAQVE